jgi:DNA recombination protein RmuC
MSETFLVLGGLSLSVAEVLILFAAGLLAGLFALGLILLRLSRARAVEAQMQALRAGEVEERMGELSRIQAETAGRLQMLGENLSGRQAELARVMAERLDAVGQRVGLSVEANAKTTVEGLRLLHERLAVIDSAQKNITDLSSQVTSLRDILGNKQARGAFGQGRMEAIVEDGLPKGAFAFQFTLSNGRRPDCVVFLPSDPRPLVIDAKFPLEAVSALRVAETEEARKQAAQRLRQDVMRHVNDISERYLLAGETQDLALMFVPSESVYAELHDGFDDVIQKAYRAQVVLVSPSLLMLAIQVMQQILKDARMREAANQIRTEVAHLTDDVGRLRERVLKLQQHFGQASEDVAQILISADKITKRGGRIETLEFEGEETAREARTAIPAPIGGKLGAAE